MLSSLGRHLGAELRVTGSVLKGGSLCKPHTHGLSSQSARHTDAHGPGSGCLERLTLGPGSAPSQAWFSHASHWLRGSKAHPWPSVGSLFASLFGGGAMAGSQDRGHQRTLLSP